MTVLFFHIAHWKYVWQPKVWANVGLDITFVQRAREINQLAVQFGCIVVFAQPHNPKLRNNLDDFAFSSPSVLWLNRTKYLGFCGSMQRKPRFMQVNTYSLKAWFILGSKVKVCGWNSSL